MAARNRKGLSENTRKRIQTTMIVKRLEDHISSKPELLDGEWVQKDLMTQSQVSAALGLLKKTLPDLVSTDSTIEVVVTNARELTDEQLADIATTGSARTTEQTDSQKEPNQVH